MLSGKRQVYMRRFSYPHCILFVCIFLFCNPLSKNDDPSPLLLELTILDSLSNRIETFSKNDTVSFQLSVTNSMPDSFQVIYSDAQRYDFYIVTANEVIWRWAQNKYFAQVVIYKSFFPNEVINFAEKWPDGQVNSVEPGDYILIGKHTGAYNGTKEISIPFKITN
jgi:hypothetical protein